MFGWWIHSRLQSILYRKKNPLKLLETCNLWVVKSLIQDDNRHAWSNYVATLYLTKLMYDQMLTLQGQINT